MSFSGKKYRRIACENIEQLASTNGDEFLNHVIKCKAPIFSFTRLDHETFEFRIEVADRVATNTFKLGEEFELRRSDGYILKMTFTLESEDVLNQVTKQPNGKIIHFRREFSKNEAKMIITIEGSDVEAKIFFEVVK